MSPPLALALCWLAFCVGFVLGAWWAALRRVVS